MQKPKPLDILIFSAAIFISLALIKKSFAFKGSRVIVQADGKRYEYSASENGVYKVQGTLGFTTFEIKDGQIRITDSPCQNKICVNQKWSSPLVCLPNDVIITLENQEKNDGQNSNKGAFDAVSQ